MRKLILLFLVVSICVPGMLFATQTGEKQNKRPTPIVRGRGFAIGENDYQVVRIVITEREVRDEPGKLMGILFTEEERYFLKVEKENSHKFSGDVFSRKEKEKIGDISLEVKEIGEKRRGKIGIGKLNLRGETYHLYLFLSGRKMKKGGD